MNKKKFLTCALATVTLAATISGGYTAFAFADGAESGYPLNFEDTLTFSGEVVDYAINGDNMAFAIGTKMELLYRDDTGDMKHAVYTHNSQIDQLEYKEGRLFFHTPAGTVYEYHPNATENNQKTTVSEFTDFQPLDTDNVQTNDNALYLLDQSGSLTYFHSGVFNTVEGGTYRLLKQYDNKLFVLNSDNVPCELDGAKATPRDMSFTDFSSANTIPVGTIAESLRNPAYTVKTASLNENAYYTKIKADLSGTYFQQIQTQKAVNGNIPCLLLYSGDDAAVFATNDGLFITSKDSLTETGYTPRDEEGLVGKTYYALDDVHIYASPFISKCTETVDKDGKEIILKKGSKNAVKVTEVFQLSYIEKVFYRVEYTLESGEKVTGFVPKDMLTPHAFASDDNKISEGGDDPDKYDYGNNVTSVLLVIIIVALVIVAVLYLALIHAKDDKKKKRKKEKTTPPQPEENDTDIETE